jgi:CBS domain containing-hemolysin-like protein
MDLPPLGGALIVLLLILANGFFVSAEFALVTVRSTRIEQLAATGSRAARLVLRAQADPNRFISAAQLGITVASLLLGWIGEETFAAMFHAQLALVLPEEGAWLTSHGLASALALMLITFLHISLGEQVPKMLALQRPESVVLLTAPPTEVVARVFRPFIYVLYAFTNLVLRMLGLNVAAEEHAAHSPDELRLLVRRSSLPDEERQLVDRAFAFSNVTAGELMVPRTEVIGMPLQATLEEVVRTVRRHRHTRFPVFDGSIDDVVGVLSAKDVVGLARLGDLRRMLRTPLFIAASTDAADVLARMRTARQPLAVVLDEFGGTAGIVTLKNLVSRVFGDVDDSPVPQEVRVLGDGSVVIGGLTLIADVNQQLGTRFDTSEVDTLGGLVFARLGRKPRVGDRVELGSGYEALVERLDGLRIDSVRLQPYIDSNRSKNER